MDQQTKCSTNLKTEKLPTKINIISQKLIKSKQKGLSVSSYARFFINYRQVILICYKNTYVDISLQQTSNLTGKYIFLTTKFLHLKNQYF